MFYVMEEDRTICMWEQSSCKFYNRFWHQSEEKKNLIYDLKLNVQLKMIFFWLFDPRKKVFLIEMEINKQINDIKLALIGKIRIK
jgi:hypothetical protein